MSNLRKFLFVLSVMALLGTSEVVLAKANTESSSGQSWSQKVNDTALGGTQFVLDGSLKNLKENMTEIDTLNTTGPINHNGGEKAKRKFDSYEPLIEVFKEDDRKITDMKKYQKGQTDRDTGSSNRNRPGPDAKRYVGGKKYEHTKDDRKIDEMLWYDESGTVRFTDGEEYAHKAGKKYRYTGENKRESNEGERDTDSLNRNRPGPDAKRYVDGKKYEHTKDDRKIDQMFWYEKGESDRYTNDETFEQEIIPGVRDISGETFEQETIPGTRDISGETFEQEIIPGARDISGETFEQETIPGARDISGETFSQETIPGARDISGETFSQETIPGARDISGKTFSQETIPGARDISGETFEQETIPGARDISGETFQLKTLKGKRNIK